MEKRNEEGVIEYKLVRLDSLKAAEYNPRKKLVPGDPEFERIVRSIETFGYVDPIIINRDGTIIGGHQRCSVMQQLGYVEVTVAVVDFDKDKEKACNIALNKITGEWDQDKLKDLLIELNDSSIDVELTGFEGDELALYLDTDDLDNQDAHEDDFDESEVQESVAKRGDVWQLGRHRLKCGDSTLIDDVLSLMGEEKADLFITDPPYNVDYVGKTDDALTIENDHFENDEDFYNLLYGAFSSADMVMQPGAAFYIWHADSEGLNFRKACADLNWKVRECLIWNKNVMVMGRQDYQWKHEPCLYGWKSGASHNWYSDRKQTTVLEFDRPARSELHPTMKPIPLFDYQIKNSSKSGDIVLDLFGGSGTTLMACEQDGRSARLCELSEHYCDVIIARWEKYTGEKAVLMNGNEAAV